MWFLLGFIASALVIALLFFILVFESIDMITSDDNVTIKDIIVVVCILAFIMLVKLVYPFMMFCIAEV